MITLTSDSTTRREIGQFIGQGNHLGQSTACLSWALVVKTKEDIATQLRMEMEILAVGSGESVEEIM